MVERDGTELLDTKRKSLFYIVAGNDDLYNKLYQIYDFNQRIKENDDSLINLFHGVDDFNFELALSAIKIRYMGN